MSVKTIFKVLFTTMVTMVLSMLLIELFNVSIVSYQLRQISRMSARQACILFTSETYKGSNDVGGAVNIQDVVTCDGTVWMSGNFYGGNPSSPGYKEYVWKKIYTSSDFQSFCNGSSYNRTGTSDLNKYYSFKVLQMAADGSYDPIPTVTWSSSDTEIAEAVKKSTAQLYRNNYYTTANIGIPYLHDEIVNKMYQWNLAQLLSNCNPDSIQKDDNGVWCVNFRGFKVYADQCKIANYDYKVYDPSPTSDNAALAIDKIWDDLNIDVTPNHIKLGGRADAKGRQGNYETEIVGVGKVYDNMYITAVGIEYNIVANYEGITPLRKLIAYVFNHQVAGFSKTGGGSAPSYGGPGTTLVDGNSTDTVSLGGIYGAKQSGGVVDSAGVITTGRLIYTLDR